LSEREIVDDGVIQRADCTRPGAFLRKLE